ncbi:hypothetical protein HAX54_000793 [Datura stramonium]|uniref:Uncharacterized protein n=1 Tax=Datura stramonium TaxID=4076 RepID=A0ABS8WUU3_DATST|nr:hypothetical protein [Datura stramonium]
MRPKLHEHKREDDQAFSHEDGRIIHAKGYQASDDTSVSDYAYEETSPQKGSHHHPRNASVKCMESVVATFDCNAYTGAIAPPNLEMVGTLVNVLANLNIGGPPSNLNVGINRPGMMQIFKMSDLPSYAGTTEPYEHVEAYTTNTNINNLQPNEIKYVMLKKFGQMLTKGALTWCTHLPKSYIDSFSMLADVFVKAHVGARKIETYKKDIIK